MKNPTCPECHEDTETLYRDDNNEIIGCPDCIEEIDAHNLQPDIKTPICGDCDEPTETFYRVIKNKTLIGCPECVSEIDAYDWRAEKIEGELADLADRRVKQFKEDGF